MQQKRHNEFRSLDATSRSDTGMQPVSEFPESWFRFRSEVDRLCRSPNSEGRPPVNWLLLKGQERAQSPKAPVISLLWNIQEAAPKRRTVYARIARKP